MQKKLARHFCYVRLARDQCSLGHAKKQPMLDDSDNLPDVRRQLMRVIDLVHRGNRESDSLHL